MKIALLLVAVVMAGCTRTRYKDFDRISFLQKSEVQKVVIRPDGTVELLGYKNDGGTEVVKAAVEAGVNAALSRITP